MTYKLSSSFSDFPREFSEGERRKKLGENKRGFILVAFHITLAGFTTYPSSSRSKVDENNFVDVKTHLAKSPEKQKMGRAPQLSKK